MNFNTVFPVLWAKGLVISTQRLTLATVILLTMTVSLLAQDAPEIRATPTGASCQNGSITATVAGSEPFAYEWSNGVKGQSTISNLTSGFYNLTVTDANGISSTESSIEVPELPLGKFKVTIESPAVDCLEKDGGATVLLTTEEVPAPYTFMWEDGFEGEKRDNLKAGNYQITLRDGNGCTVVETITINSIVAPNAITFGYTIDSGIFGVRLKATEDLEAADSFLWNLGNGRTSTAIEPFVRYTSQGIYDVTLTVSNACGDAEYSSSINFVFPPHLVVFDIGDACGVSGDKIRIPITAPNCPPNTVTFQGQVMVDKTKVLIQGIESAAFKSEDIQFNPATNQLSALNMSGLMLEQGDTLFFLVVELIGEDKSLTDIYFNPEWFEVGILTEGKAKRLEEYFLIGGAIEVLTTSELKIDILTFLGDAIKNVLVTIESTVSPDQQALTNKEGQTQFVLRPKQQHILSCSKEGNIRNGVTSTFNLWLLRSYLVGEITPEISSEYQLISADVDGNGRLTTLDILNIQMLIVGMLEELDGPSWVFVPADYDDSILDPNNILVPDSTHYLNMLSDSSMQMVGVKKGDIMGDADPQRFRLATPRMGNLSLVGYPTMIEEQVVEFKCYLDVAEINLTAFQGEFQYSEQLEFLGMKSSQESLAETLCYAIDNKLKFSFYQPDGKETAIKGVDEFFILRFRLKEPTTDLSDLLWLASKEALPANIHTKDREVFAIDFSIAKPAPPAIDVSGIQVLPNPMGATSNVVFNLAKEEAAKLSIYDVIGHQVYTKTGQFYEGENTFQITRSLLPSSGTYFIVLEAADSTARTRFIVSE